MTVHDFQRSLDRSHGYAAAPWWETVYRQAFPTYQSMACVRDDGAGQRNGIDRHIALSNGRTITVDEKVREQEYDDFFLEYWSSVESQTRGWVAKDLACDFIAYAFVQSGRCYLMPFPLLRRAWTLYGPRWCEKYKHHNALNQNYTTRGLCVPIDVVLAALSTSTLVTFDPPPVREAA